MKGAVATLAGAIKKTRGIVSVEWVAATDLDPANDHEAAWWDRADLLGGLACEHRAPCLGCDRRLGDNRVPASIIVIQRHFCVAICDRCTRRPWAELVAKLKRILPAHIRIIEEARPERGDAPFRDGPPLGFVQR
jgi:hypothetical protein